jgi:hypothetical protein
MKIMNINETNRIKLLMGYDVKKTLTENLEPLLEQPQVWKNLISKGGKALDDIFKNGTLKTTTGKAVNSADELSTILKKGSATALDDASGTLLSNTFLKNPSISLSDKSSLIKSITNSDDVINLYRGKSQSDIAKLFKKQYPDDVADEIANKLANRSAGSTQGLTAAEKAQYQKLAQAEKARLGNKNLGQFTREKLIQQVTVGGKKATSAQIKAILADANQKVLTQGASKWSFSRWLQWGVGLLIGGAGVYAIVQTMRAEDTLTENPEGTPKEAPIEDGNTGGGNTGGGNTGGGEYQPKEDGAYTTPGDPYQYRVVNGQWETKSWKNKGKIIKNWRSLENNQTATNELDRRHPGVRIKGNTKPDENQSQITPNPNIEPEFEDIEGEESSDLIDNL